MTAHLNLQERNWDSALWRHCCLEHCRIKKPGTDPPARPGTSLRHMWTLTAGFSAKLNCTYTVHTVNVGYCLVLSCWINNTDKQVEDFGLWSLSCSITHCPLHTTLPLVMTRRTEAQETKRRQVTCSIKNIDTSRWCRFFFPSGLGMGIGLSSVHAMAGHQQTPVIVVCMRFLRFLSMALYTGKKVSPWSVSRI